MLCLCYYTLVLRWNTPLRALRRVQAYPHDCAAKVLFFFHPCNFRRFFFAFCPKSTTFAVDLSTLYMKKTLLGLTFVSLFLLSCGPKHPTAAERRIEKHMQDSIALRDQQRSLAYYDSLLQALAPTADSLLLQFRYEKNPQYESRGKYTHKQLRTTGNASRNYLQAYVYDDGTTELKCFYYGANAIGLNEIVLEADSMRCHFGGDAYAFEAEGRHETLTLCSEDARQCLQFIDAYSGKRIRVMLQGTRSRAVFYLQPNDKDALMSTYRMGTVMHDMRELETRIRQTSLQIDKYTRRVQ